METKKCTKCGRELPLSDFQKNANNADGLQAWCRECMAESYRARRAKLSPPAEPGYSDPEFDGRQPGEVIQLMGRAKRWLEAQGYTITLKGTYTQVREVKF